VSTTQLWFDMLGGLNRLYASSRLARIPSELPLYVMAGERDPVSSGTRGLRKLLDVYSRLGLRRVTHRFYPNARHELFNEINRDEVRAHLLTWIDDVLKG
jgi:alpha-beta hydrolase superfamily lysophospholipase